MDSLRAPQSWKKNREERWEGWWLTDRDLQIMQEHKTRTYLKCIFSVHVNTSGTHFPFFKSFAGSSDIQEDYSEKQCQEEEAVWGIHWNATTAYFIGGLRITPWIKRLPCAFKDCQPNVFSSTALRENEGCRCVILQGVQWLTADYCSGDESLCMWCSLISCFPFLLQQSIFWKQDDLFLHAQLH